MTQNLAACSSCQGSDGLTCSDNFYVIRTGIGCQELSRWARISHHPSVAERYLQQGFSLST